MISALILANDLELNHEVIRSKVEQRIRFQVGLDKDGPLDFVANDQKVFDGACLSVGRDKILISHHNMPASAVADLETAAFAASWHWPEAMPDIARHSSHVLVAMQHHEPATGFFLVTHAVAAICEAHPTIGVLWPGGAALTRTARFLKLSERARHSPISDAWLSLSVEKLPDGRFEALTHGLVQFGHAEVGTREADFGELIEVLFSVADYLIESGATLEHGQTFGFSKEDQRPIRHAPAPWDPDQFVVWIGD